MRVKHAVSLTGALRNFTDAWKCETTEEWMAVEMGLVGDGDGDRVGGTDKGI